MKTAVAAQLSALVIRMKIKFKNNLPPDWFLPVGVFFTYLDLTNPNLFVII